jgi:tetratricopeptide (TPR) repeat protein
MLPYFESDLLVESYLAPLGTGLALLLLRAGETGSARRWLGVGLVLGAYSITRPTLLAFAPVAFVFALGWLGDRFDLRAFRLRAAVAVTAGACAFVLPTAALNAIVGHDRVLVAWHGGLNFFLGNNPEANGWSATAPRVLGMDWWGGYEDAIRIAEEARGRSLRPSEVSEYWFERAKTFWREHTGDALLITLKKATFVLSGTEFFNNRDIRLFFAEFAPLGSWSLHLYQVVMPLAVAGAFFLWRTRRVEARILVLLTLVHTLTTVAFFVTARYRAPMRPLLGLFAVVAAAELWRSARRGGVRGWAPVAGVAAFGLAADLNPWLAIHHCSPAQFYQSVAGIRHGQERYEEALGWHIRAFEADSTYLEVNLNLGTMFMQFDRPAEALAAFERERRLDPTDGRNLASLAQALSRLGRWEEAERAYADAEATGFADAPALYNHGRALEMLGRSGEATILYRRALAADSTLADAWNNLGVLAARDGRLEEARENWEKAVASRPDYAPALDNLSRLRETSATPPGGPRGG